ncbi:carboxypeptidase-like regulatory domain-containing protein [Chitinophaga deserti]|uniref:carboxypeptidase-like regulatory domain-containing protein n=1 Tax=Chitinophaga deserti TaxID=2164099 RepID=UPI0013005B68|nr:carboxypeptidase-like regulatory domain-containing protein [Chitinophaga deserti]
MKRISSLCIVALVCCMACSKSDSKPNPNDPDNPGGQEGVPTIVTVPKLQGDTTITMGPNTNYAIALKGLPTIRPVFPKLQPKPKKVRGYVTDASGNPIEGAFLGLRVRVSGLTTVATGTTNEKGYYEIAFEGAAEFFQAYVTVNYVEKPVPISLFAADTTLPVYTMDKGGVKHWIALSHGTANLADVQHRPWLSNNYFGGSIYLNWDVYEDMWSPEGALPMNGEIIVKLTPAGGMMYGETRTFTIRQKIGDKHLDCNINNLPIGIYKIEAKLADGRPLEMEVHGPNRSDTYGLQYDEGTKAWYVAFMPGYNATSKPMPNRGEWDQANVHVEL